MPGCAQGGVGADLRKHIADDENELLALRSEAAREAAAGATQADSAGVDLATADVSLRQLVPKGRSLDPKQEEIFGRVVGWLVGLQAAGSPEKRTAPTAGTWAGPASQAPTQPASGG